MRTLMAFMKKEWMEQLRSGKFTIISILFICLGIMNTAVAKLTPWLLETMADSLAQSGMTVTAVEVSALDSWMQFFKNAPMALIAFVLVESGIFTKEYEKGTLVQPLTKGLARYKVVVSKTMVLTVLWTLLYWIYFGITYGYNAYFWDNSVAQNMLFSVMCWWLAGLLTMLMLVFFSSFTDTSTVVLGGTATAWVFFYVASLFAKVKKYSPAILMDGTSLIYGEEVRQEYLVAIVVTVVLCVLSFASAVRFFNKRKL